MSRPPVPVTVIGGYLGAGKTSLVNHLLRRSGLRLGVLVNEFGALPIDADLIEAEGEALISIAGGCVCCAFGDDLAGGLRDLAALDPAPEHVLVEASGVALPGAVAGTVSLVREAALGAVLVLADAETVRGAAAERYMGDTVLRQIADADLIVLTKTDLADPGPVRAWLSGLTRAPVAEARHGALDPALALGPHPGRAPPVGAHHAPGLASVALDPGGADARALAAALAGAPEVVRAKGFVGDGGGLVLVQVVGARWRIGPAPGGAEPGLVCIGPEGLDADGIGRIVRAAATGRH